jgi:phosphoheptose isomerase
MPETEQIRKRLFDHIDSIASSLENLPDPISKASDILVKTLLNDGKVIIGAESRQTILASYFTSVMLSRYHHERPTLPALNLSSDITTISTLTQDNNSQSVIFSLQIQALAHSNDLVVLFSMSGKETSILQAIRAAHEREVPCIILSSSKDDNLQSLINEQDVLITINQDKPSAVIEGQLLTINILGELIDQQLFGV